MLTLAAGYGKGVGNGRRVRGVRRRWRGQASTQKETAYGGHHPARRGAGTSHPAKADSAGDRPAPRDATRRSCFPRSRREELLTTGRKLVALIEEERQVAHAVHPPEERGLSSRPGVHGAAGTDLTALWGVLLGSLAEVLDVLEAVVGQLETQKAHPCIPSTESEG